MEHRAGVYVMQVAAMLTGLHPQTLRKYERFGLVNPARMNTLRLYSEEDIALCRLIHRLVDEMGLNLAGVELALRMQEKLHELREELSDSQTANQNECLTLIDEMLQILEGQ